MESDVTQSATFYKGWAWFEKNKRHVMTGIGVAIILGIVIGFILWQREQKVINAGEAVSAAVYGQIADSDRNAAPAEPFIKLANEYPNMSAGARALLLGAGNLFVQGKYDQALTQFQKFAREHRDSPFVAQAQLGVASCQEALGKTNEAVIAYKSVVDHHSSDPAAPQAKFALARIYEAQNQPKEAYNLLEEIARSEPFGSIGSEAGMRAEEIKLKHPEVVPPPPAPAPALSSTNLTPANPIPTNTSAVVPRNTAVSNSAAQKP